MQPVVVDDQTAVDVHARAVIRIGEELVVAGRGGVQRVREHEAKRVVSERIGKSSCEFPKSDNGMFW